MLSFGDKLYQLRKCRGWSQEELAEKMDISRQTVSKWESGKNMPDLTKLKKLSEIFGVTLDELVNGEMLVATERNTIPENVQPVKEEERNRSWVWWRRAGIMMLLVIAATVLIWSLPLQKEEEKPYAPVMTGAVKEYLEEVEFSEMDDLRYYIEEAVWNTSVMKLELSELTTDRIRARLEYEGISKRYTDQQIQECIGFVLRDYFWEYEYHGLIYYSDEHRLYINGVPVRYFEDANEGTGFSAVQWTFEEGDAFVYTRRDGGGKLTALETENQKRP